MPPKRVFSSQTKKIIGGTFLFFSLILAGALTGQALEETPPALEIVEKPKATYSLNDVVSYKIRLHFSATATESLRLKPPTVDFQNLEFLGVSQETTSHGSRESGSEEILTFRFRPLKAGRSQIREIELKWVHEDGSEGPSLKIPAAEFKARNPISPYFKWVPIGALFVFGSVFPLVYILRKRKKPPTAPPPGKSLEEIFLGELDLLKNEIGRKKSAEFLDRLGKISESYMTQKLDWNGPRDGYNTLNTKAQTLWVKKDAQLLEEWFKKLERLRFSGEEVSEHELLALHQTVYSLAAKRKVV